jgi:hypothetical protein
MRRIEVVVYVIEVALPEFERHYVRLRRYVPIISRVIY